MFSNCTLKYIILAPWNISFLLSFWLLRNWMNCLDFRVELEDYWIYLNIYECMRWVKYEYNIYQTNISAENLNRSHITANCSKQLTQNLTRLYNNPLTFTENICECQNCEYWDYLPLKKKKKRFSIFFSKWKKIIEM